MARFTADEIEEPGFYWMKKSGRSTVVEIKNISLTLGAQTYPMWHIMKPGSMGWTPLHQERDAKFNGPIKPPRGFTPLEAKHDSKPNAQG